MLRKTLIAMTAVSALCIGSTAAMAAHGMGGGGGGMGGGHGWGGGGGGMMNSARTPMMNGGAHMGGPMTMHAGPMNAAPMTRGPMTTGPITRGNVQGWNGQWGNNRGHFHNHFHNRNFFAFGFGGPIYDYAAGSCWSYVPTAYGWQYVYVCGDYYGYGY